VDLTRLAHLPWLILQPSVASAVLFYEFPHEPLALLSQRFYRKKLSAICVKEKNFKQCRTYSLDRNRHENSGYNPLLPQTFFGGNPFVDGILGHNLLLSRAFWWESFHGWDFRPQLVVVSGLFGGNPFRDGILGHNLLLSRAFLVGIPSWMGF
jgi:hypothetical protein